MSSIHSNFPSKDESIAYSVSQKLNKFVVKFDDRTTDPGSLKRILEGEDFNGGIVKQAPEFFTEKYLIEPLLESLGFEEIRWRPVELTKCERNQPDLLINDTNKNLVCIVESKALAQESKLAQKKDNESAQQQIEEYLKDDTFVKYATEIDRKYLVGIGTDGVHWSLQAKPIGERSAIQIDEVSVREELIEIIRYQRQTSKSSSVGVKNVRLKIVDTLIPTFAKHNLQNVIKDEVQNRY